MKKNNFLTPAPADYKWPCCPEADRFINDTLQVFLGQHSFASNLSQRMMAETSTHFAVWVDHLLLSSQGYETSMLQRLGFCEDKKVRRPAGAKVFFHPFADLPRLVISPKTKAVGCAIMVDRLWEFQMAHGLSLPIEGAPHSTYRRMRIREGASDLVVVERRGTQTLIPDTRDRSRKYMHHFERWATRLRRFDSDDKGMKYTLKLARETVKDLGTGSAADIFLETERIYWQSRNRAAQIQKSRQDRLGLGWANHDHHTFRSSRAHFRTLIEILMTLGFKLRERYYAGAEAGWGAQIVEQPEAGVIIFADVDLAPEEVLVDFTRARLPEIDKYRTVGLWCALHGESMLGPGMHHLEAKFEFDKLKEDLKTRQIETMPPFSDFPFLRQAFTKAEMWAVDSNRLEALRMSRKISDDAYRQMKANGAVGSHLENLQRRDGFKGFNQKGVSEIIKAVHPERQALS